MNIDNNIPPIIIWQDETDIYVKVLQMSEEEQSLCNRRKLYIAIETKITGECALQHHMTKSTANGHPRSNPNKKPLHRVYTPRSDDAFYYHYFFKPRRHNWVCRYDEHGSSANSIAYRTDDYKPQNNANINTKEAFSLNTVYNFSKEYVFPRRLIKMVEDPDKSQITSSNVFCYVRATLRYVNNKQIKVIKCSNVIKAVGY